MKKVSDTLGVIRISAMKHEDKETAGIAESLSRQMEYLIGSYKLYGSAGKGNRQHTGVFPHHADTV